MEATAAPGSGAPAALGIAAGVLGAVAVAAGAFGAHSLRGRLEPAALATFETAVRYQLVHALAAAFAADRAGKSGSAAAAWASGSFVSGALLFSGSLYALALGGPRLAGLVTPFGGLSFIAGWLLLAASFGRR